RWGALLLVYLGISLLRSLRFVRSSGFQGFWALKIQVDAFSFSIKGSVMRILFIGDIFGSAGRRIVREHLGHVVERNNVDLIIANAENSAGGFGLTPAIADELFD